MSARIPLPRPFGPYLLTRGLSADSLGETFRAGTLCEGAALELRRVEADWRCPACRRPIEKGAVLSCPACGKPAALAEGADAILLETIEMEVP